MLFPNNGEISTENIWENFLLPLVLAANKQD